MTHPEAFLLTQWLEKGVFAALESEYLHSMIFAVYTKHPITKQDILIETYDFKMSYFSETEAKSKIKAAKINGVELGTKDSVKKLASAFIKNLSAFAGSLDLLPPDRWITIQLKVIELINQLISYSIYSMKITLRVIMNQSILEQVKKLYSQVSYPSI